MVSKAKYRSGFVAVAGFPNVGKSTLMNRIIGSKLAIVTPKPQTTRGTVRGIFTTDKAQIIFFDTPGIHRPQDKLGDYMLDAAKKSFENSDMIYLIVESSIPDRLKVDLVKHVQDAGKRTFLIVNKSDLVKKSGVLPVIDYYSKVMEFEEIIPVSALNGDNIDKLIDLTVSRLPESPPYFPEDIVSDQVEREFIAEFIRERVYYNTREEIPYSTAVVIEDMEERPGGGAYIVADIYLEKKSQKGILIGKAGGMIKKIGQEARGQIEQFLGYSVYLDVRVKIEKNWRRDSKALRKLGYK